MKRVLMIVPMLALVLGAAPVAQNIHDWPTVGNDPGGMKYLHAHANHAGQRRAAGKAWTYDTGAPASGYTVTPIVINNVMYLPVQGSIDRRAQGRRRDRTLEVRPSKIPALGAEPVGGRPRDFVLARHAAGSRRAS